MIENIDVVISKTMFVCKRYGGKAFLLGLMMLVTPVAWSQGFIEMPDTTEVPEYEEESMLLDLDIPAVRDRDPDPQGGPRLNVKEFRVQGLVEYPKLGITRTEINKRVEAIRFDIMKEGKKSESGFNYEELGEMSALVAEIEKTTKAQHVGALEVQKFVFLIREQLRKRGVTVGMIEAVADTITSIYREKGFILAKAYIPKQKVRDGIVTLTLLLGELGDIKVEDNKRVSSTLVENVFKRDLYKPVTNDSINEALYLINDIPGVDAQGYFSPGEQVGDTLMTVKVTEEKWVTSNIRLDNHGSENTSENRAYADIYVHNPLGIGDEVYIGVLNSFDPGSTTYGSFRYNTFITNPRVRASIGTSTNDFVSRNIRQEGAPVFTGASDVSDISLSYIFKRSRVRNFSTELKYMDIQTELDNAANLTTTEDVKKTSLSFNFDVLNEKRRQLYIGSVGLHSASTFETGGFEGDVTGDDKFLTFDLSMLTFFKIPFTKKKTRFLTKTSGQYAGKAISNLNQINLTGPSRARGFGVNGFQADDGMYLGVDWIFDFPSFGEAKLFGESISKVFQPYVFVDAAYGILQPLEETDSKITGTLTNYGVGLKISHSNFASNISYSSVMTDDVNELQEETPASGVYFEMQYSF